MPTEIVMPKWGLSMQEGTIGIWLKAEGEAVAAGEPVVEIETEKITNVVEAPADGVLAQILYPVGSVVPVTEVIAVITAPGEAPPPRITPGAFPAAAALATALPAAEGGAVASASGPTIRAMPAARKLAREHDLDLASVTGTGPGGAITREDVERALAAPRPTSRPAASLAPLQKVSFYSEGHRLAGLLYQPRDLKADERRPGVVLLVGYTYLKTMVMPDIAKVLTAAGRVALVFDYRGFGESEGPRWRLMPHEQVADARAALTFLADQPSVDPERLAVVGISLGGAHAISLAALDERIKAAVALEPPGDGRRWLRSLRPHWQWLDFLRQIEHDRRQRVHSGQSQRVDPQSIVVPDPESRAFLDGVAAEFPEMRGELPLESAEALIEYSPEAVVGQIAPRRLLIVHGAEDRLVPVDEARQLAARAGDSSRLVVLAGVSHFSWVLPNSPGFQQVTGLITAFLDDQPR